MILGLQALQAFFEDHGARHTRLGHSAFSKTSCSAAAWSRESSRLQEFVKLEFLCA